MCSCWSGCRSLGSTHSVEVMIKTKQTLIGFFITGILILGSFYLLLEPQRKISHVQKTGNAFLEASQNLIASSTKK